MTWEKIKPWVPLRLKEHKDKTAFESANRKIWLSWGGDLVRFHVSLGPLDIMWMERRNNRRT